MCPFYGLSNRNTELSSNLLEVTSLASGESMIRPLKKKNKLLLERER